MRERRWWDTPAWADRTFVVMALAAALMVGGLLLPAVTASAANGDQLFRGTRGGLEWIVYYGLDAEEDQVTAGTAIYVGGWQALTVFPTAGVDSGDTWSVDCSVSGGPDRTPTNWDEVLAENTGLEGYAMPDGHVCEWIRVNKPTDTNDATTVLVMVTRPVLP